MKNNQLFPFERNRYFAGKMLTSSDFQAEQIYFNNKRRFVNSLLYGSGIVCGCNVFSLDDLSVLVESGAAIDDFGREIVIPSSSVKKLSAIEGFSEIQGDEVLLCLRYQETLVHSVFAVNRQGREDAYEYNRISEGYELFLKDASEEAACFALESEFFMKNLLYGDKDYRVELTMPSAVCKGAFVKLHIELTKLSGSTEPVGFGGVLQMPSFVSGEGTHELSVDFEPSVLLKGQSLERDFWVEAERTEEAETNLVLKDGKGNQSFKVQLRDTDPDALVTEELGKTSLEMSGLEEKKDYIPLAHLRLLRTDSAYIIDEVTEHGVKKYINVPGREEERRKYKDYFCREGFRTFSRREKDSQEIAVCPEDISGKSAPVVSTGTVEIPVGGDARKGDVCYSGEVMHGLGRGNVYVELGYESYDGDSVPGANKKSTVYGNAALFGNGPEGISNIETAVKVLNDKGSFIVAAKLLKNVDCLVLTYRWVAMLFPSGEETWKEDFDNKSITAETPTVVLGARESYYFNVKFHNMEKCSVAYELTEGGSGEITADGVYTAPRREGVYEIRIYCTDMPVICTYAYAIVRGNRGREKEQE